MQSALKNGRLGQLSTRGVRSCREHAPLLANALMHLVNDGCFVALYPILPLIASEFGLSYAQVGMLKTALSSSSTALQIPMAMLAERFGEIAFLALGMAWVAGLGSHYPNVRTIAFTAVRDWQFVRPIFFGDTVHVETICVEKAPAGKRNGKVVWHRKLINDSGLMVQEGFFETLVALADSSRKPHFDLSDIQQTQSQ